MPTARRRNARSAVGNHRREHDDDRTDCMPSVLLLLPLLWRTTLLLWPIPESASAAESFNADPAAGAAGVGDAPSTLKTFKVEEAVPAVTSASEAGRGATEGEGVQAGEPTGAAAGAVSPAGEPDATICCSLKA